MAPSETRRGGSERAILASLTLPGLEKSAGHVRRFARDTLGERHPALDDVQTCVNEAFTNGIEHTASGCGGKVTVTFMEERGTVLAEVTDDGAGGARPRVMNESLAESGRGMRIIDALADGWGFRSDGDRTTVWMRFPGPANLAGRDT